MTAALRIVLALILLASGTSSLRAVNITYLEQEFRIRAEAEREAARNRELEEKIRRVKEQLAEIDRILQTQKTHQRFRRPLE